MNQMEIFKNPEFGSIRVIEENGKYLFCGTDVAAALGYSNPRDAIIRHCRCVVKRDAPHPQSPDRKISMTFIPEGDLYRLIVHSKLPSAERFNGGCSMRFCLPFVSTGPISQKRSCGRLPLPPEALMKLCSDLLAEREANISLRKENAQLEGKAAFYDLFIDLKHSTNLRTTAKKVGCPGAPVCPVSDKKAVCVPHSIRQCAALCQCEKYRAVLRQRLLQSRSYRFLHAGHAPGEALLCPAAGDDLAGLIRTERKWVLCRKGKTIGQLMEEMRQKAGEQNYHGHDYMDLQRFAENTRHMIIFDVLTHDSPVGWKRRTHPPVFVRDRL